MCVVVACVQVWIAGLVFFIVNIGILCQVMLGHVFTPVFEEGGVLSRLQSPSASADADSSESDHSKSG